MTDENLEFRPVTIHIYNKPVVLTVETIKTTLQWYADHERRCAAGATSGDFFVNDVDSYVAGREWQAAEYERQIEEGMDERMSLAFIQQAYYIQSGESVPMLSK